MIDRELFLTSLPPALATSIFATSGFVGWIRLRRGIYPRAKHVGLQLAFSFTAGGVYSYGRLASRQRSRDALLRLIQVTEGTQEVSVESPGAVRVAVSEYDTATGVDGEAEAARMLKEAVKVR